MLKQRLYVWKRLSFSITYRRNGFEVLPVSRNFTLRAVILWSLSCRESVIWDAGNALLLELDDKDVACLSDLLRSSDSLRASSLADLDRLPSSIQDLQRKIESCKEKTEVARAEVVADSGIDMLPKELDEVLRKEKNAD
ncbi:hypothetical protein MLD38_036391 [Melastoma candidum]|uniref:Uncharacterized protein n=1 Tax=Melastoma candidum TaxID=119954 RepID=A0ACB9LJ22_9MYRT|nr:hypothetical protein MLD38_036391 [Melastoma candidum]